MSPLASTRYATLDAWRGLACLFIVVLHSTTVITKDPSRADTRLAQMTAWLEVGVPMFFVISGYCISATADSARRKGLGPIDFFRRRFRRIFPPFWAAVAVQALALWIVETWVWPGLLSGSIVPIFPPWSFDGWQWFGNLTLTESWRFHVVGSPQNYVLGQSWTLCYEEQFYAVTGLLLILARRRFFGAALVTTAGVIVVMRVAAFTGTLDRLGGFFFDGKWITFAYGIAIYYAINYRRRWTGPACLLFLCVGIAVGLRGGRTDWATAGAFAAILLLTHRWDEAISRQRALRPLEFCGQICYSLYLTHALIVRGLSQAAAHYGLTDFWMFLLVVLPVCVAAAVVYGRVFFWLVEKRFLNSRVTSPGSP